MQSDTLTAAAALRAALERGEHGDALRPYFTDDATVREYPNRIKPAGGSADLAALLDESTRGAGLLRSQRYDVVDEFAVGDTAVARLTWTGIVAADLGPFTAGQELTAHIAQFVRVRDGRVASIATYDCYEPF